MTHNYLPKKYIFYFFFFSLGLNLNIEPKSNKLSLLAEIGITAGISSLFIYGIDYTLSSFINREIFICKNISDSNETVGFLNIKKKINNLIKRIEKNQKELSKKTILFVSKEPEIQLYEKKLIQEIAEKLILPFCEIKIDKINPYNLSYFSRNLKKNTLNENKIYFFTIKEENINAIFFSIIDSINNHLLHAKKSFFTLYTDEKTFSHLKEYFTTAFQEIIFLESPDKEARKDQIEKIIEKNNIVKNKNLSIEYMAKMTTMFSFTKIEKLFIDIMEIIDSALDQKELTREIFTKCIEEISNDQEQEQSLMKSNSEPKTFYPTIIRNLSFQDISGYEKVKEDLLDIVTQNNATGILLWGPPGNGKTFFAKALAGELCVPFFNIYGSDLESPFVGVTELNIKNLFLKAKEYPQSIIFIDEAESLIPHRNKNQISAYKISTTNEFLNQLNENKNIIFIVASNTPESLDPALLRPGRIDKKVKIDYPTEKDRKLIISNLIEKNAIKINEEFNIEKVSKLLDGFNCAAINNFMKKITELKIINQESIFEIYKKIQKEENIGQFCFEESKTSFNDIGGYTHIKKEVQKELIEKLISPDALRKRIPGCIISGPPGTGKTLLGEAIAKEAGLPFIKITTAKLLEEYPHGIEKLFQAIQKNRPCIVIFDEAEQIFISREKANSMQKDIITDFLEKTGSKHSLTGVCFIGITNYPELLDTAITRPGRLHKKYILDYPEFQDRFDIINLYLKKLEIQLNNNISLKKIVERTNGMLPAEIEHLFEIAKELITEENKETLDDQILAESYQQIILGKKRNIALNEKEIKQTAYHEAAHGIITFLLDKKEQGYFHFDFLTIEPRARALGISFSRHSAEYKSMKKEMILGLISICLAGKAAQEIIFNQIDTGASDDLVQATKLAEDYVKKYAMNKQLYVEPNSKNSEKEKETIEEILQTQYNKLKNFFKKHKKILDIIVREVMIKKIIHEEDLDEIIKNYEKKTQSELIFIAN
jgi:cell division protease FtsH